MSIRPWCGLTFRLMTWTATGEEAFFRVVRAGFSQKRKQLQKNLRQLGHGREQIDAALEAAGIDGRRRAETLTLDEWRALVTALADALIPSSVTLFLSSSSPYRPAGPQPS